MPPLRNSSQTPPHPPSGWRGSSRAPEPRAARSVHPARPRVGLGAPPRRQSSPEDPGSIPRPRSEHTVRLWLRALRPGGGTPSIPHRPVLRAALLKPRLDPKTGEGDVLTLLPISTGFLSLHIFLIHVPTVLFSRKSLFLQFLRLSFLVTPPFFCLVCFFGGFCFVLVLVFSFWSLPPLPPSFRLSLNYTLWA